MGENRCNDVGRSGGRRSRCRVDEGDVRVVEGLIDQGWVRVVKRLVGKRDVGTRRRSKRTGGPGVGYG